MLKHKKLIMFLIVILAFALYLYIDNNRIVVSKYEVKDENVPKSFNGFKILQISDLHNRTFGKNDSYIIDKIRKEKPNIIVITGDFIDRRRYNEQKAMILIKGINKIAPIYYVPGNHEGWSGKYANLRKTLLENGVKLLENKGEYIKKGKDEIYLCGVLDPAFYNPIISEDYKDASIMEHNINKINKNKDYKVLLSHRPELFDTYIRKDINLVFTGHAHGGQIALPFIGAIIAPNQGLFPKYYKGIHKMKNTTMIISKGLGNSLIPFRTFSTPEIVSVKLVATSS